MQNSFYREIVNDHNLRPAHKHELPDANMELRGVNPSCGDDITLYLYVEDGIIKDGAFTGDGCAISQASADMMLDLIIGKKKEEALHLSELFLRMIKGSVSESELDELEEAGDNLAGVQPMQAADQKETQKCQNEGRAAAERGDIRIVMHGNDYGVG